VAHPFGFGVEGCRVELLILPFRPDLGHLGLVGQEVRLLGGSGGVDGLVDAGTAPTASKATATIIGAPTGDASLSFGDEIAPSSAVVATDEPLAACGTAPRRIR